MPIVRFVAAVAALAARRGGVARRAGLSATLRIAFSAVGGLSRVPLCRPCMAMPATDSVQSIATACGRAGPAIGRERRRGDRASRRIAKDVSAPGYSGISAFRRRAPELGVPVVRESGSGHPEQVINLAVSNGWLWPQSRPE